MSLTVPVPPEPPALPRGHEQWPREWQFGWRAVPLAVPVLTYAYVAPVDSLEFSFAAALIIVVVSRIAALIVVTRRHTWPPIGFVVSSVVRDAVGLCGLAALYSLGVIFAMYVVAPAIGHGGVKIYSSAIKSGARSHFTPAQIGVIAHTVTFVPTVFIAAVLLLRFRGDLRRPLVLPRLARRLREWPMTSQVIGSAVLIAAAGVLVAVNKGVDVAKPPAGPICKIAPITCNAVEKQKQVFGQVTERQSRGRSQLGAES